MSGSVRFLLITRRMRSDPASGAMVTLRVPPRASAAASRGVTQSALSEDGDSRPPPPAANLGQRIHTRDARHLGTDETNRLPVLQPGADGVFQLVDAARTDGPVHVPGGAEPAPPLAAA